MHGLNASSHLFLPFGRTSSSVCMPTTVSRSLVGKVLVIEGDRKKNVNSVLGFPYIDCLPDLTVTTVYPLSRVSTITDLAQQVNMDGLGTNLPKGGHSPLQTPQFYSFYGLVLVAGKTTNKLKES